jgi:molybdopterin synthase sulfur carrier subunit
VGIVMDHASGPGHEERFMSTNGAVTVLIPTPLRKFTGGEGRLTATGATVGEVIEALERQHPGLRERVCDAEGELRRFVNVFVNGVNARDQQGIATPVKPGDEIGIIPAMAGGAARQ